jgi:hypothetical protein
MYLLVVKIHRDVLFESDFGVLLLAFVFLEHTELYFYSWLYFQNAPRYIFESLTVVLPEYIGVYLQA